MWFSGKIVTTVAFHEKNLVVFQVGAPPEISCLLDDIRRDNSLYRRDSVSSCLGADPELDEFMVSLYFCKFSLNSWSSLSAFLWISPPLSLSTSANSRFSLCSFLNHSPYFCEFSKNSWFPLPTFIWLSLSLSLRKLSVIYWWSTNLISQGILMKHPPSWTRFKFNCAIFAQVR